MNANPRRAPTPVSGPTPPVLAIAATALGGVVVVLLAAAVALGEMAHQSVVSSAASGAPLIVAFLVVGVVVARRQPRHPIGWMLLGMALFFMVTADASTYSVLDYRDHRGLPLGWLAVVLQPSWAPAIVLFGVAIMLFPDGNLPARRWRWVMWAYLSLAAVWVFGAFGISVAAVIEGHVHVTSGGDLTTLDHARGRDAWWADVQNLYFLAFAAILLGWLVYQIPRFRRATGERRQQLKWLMGGGAVAVICGLIAVSGGAAGGVAIVGVTALPFSLGIAILKYRLYDIDVIIRKTLVYATLVGMLAVVYLIGVYLIDELLQTLTGQSSALAVTISTLVVAAAFQPLRTRIQRAVDHRFYRQKYDSATTLDAFTSRLREQIDLDALHTDVLDVIQATVRPAHASIWLRPPDKGDRSSPS